MSAAIQLKIKPKTKQKRENKMTKSEMLNSWKNTSAIKTAFSKMLGDKYPSLATTEPKLLAKIDKTLKDLTAELEKITKDPVYEASVKTEKKDAEKKDKAEDKA